MAHQTEGIKAYEQYRGTNPCPADFQDFWKQRMAEADQVPLDFEITDCEIKTGGNKSSEIKNSEIKSSSHSLFQELRFQGLDGSPLWAKYIRPVAEAGKKVPLVLLFHGYPGATRSWFELASYAGNGFAVLAVDCPGQGGNSHDHGSYAGTTVSGHLIEGLDGPAEGMYYVRMHQHIRILCRIVRHLQEIDQTKVFVHGGSQGGALALACAALNPSLIKKAVILYPFLSDYQKIWELGADVIPYEGLRYYSRWYDPKGERTAEIFTKLGYIDTINFAPLVKAPVLFGTGLSDVWCLPVTQYAVYNRLTCSKKHILYPEFGHEEIQDFDDRTIPFFCEENPIWT